MADNVLIINRLRVVRATIRKALAEATDLTTTPGCRTLEEALPRLEKLRPSVVVLDHSESTPREITRAINSVPGTKVVISGITLNEKAVGNCAAAGASGYVDTDASDEDWVAAILGAINGEIPNPKIGGLLNRCLNRLQTGAAHQTHSPESSAWRVPERVKDSAMRAGLTPRERQIVSLIDKGYSNKQIANELCVEPSTIKNHVHSILGKYNVRGRAEAAARYRESVSAEKDLGSPSDLA